jgi:TetR/AcrR family transcriptional regulator, transcriptional repressor for nem operon
MRYSAEHNAQTRARVLREAAKAIRANGPDGVAVAEVMKRAGLTHGGFYSHFESKDHLVTEAIGEMFRDAQAVFDRHTLNQSAKDGLRAYIDYYLSTEHRDMREGGCPVAALSGDLARMEDSQRRGFERGLARLTLNLESLLNELKVPNPAAGARSGVSEMAGALLLARAVTDPARSEEILAGSRASLKARFSLS